MGKAYAYMGDDGMWGVEQDGGVVYDADFCRVTAEAVAELQNCDNPPADWEETAERLDIMGLPY